MWWLLLLKTHVIERIRTSSDTRYLEILYPSQKTGVVAAELSEEQLHPWKNTNVPIFPEYMVWRDKYCEYPVVQATDELNLTYDEDQRKERGSRFFFDVTHPVRSEDADKGFEQTMNAAKVLSGTQPYDPRRAAIWCIAAPGVKLTTSALDNAQLEYPPVLNIVRVQDVDRVPGAGEVFSPDKFFQVTRWVLVEGPTEYEILVNPTAEELTRLGPIVQQIVMQELYTGADFYVFSGSDSDALGFKVEVRVTSHSDKERFWYGIERVRGAALMRLRIVTGDTESVAFKPIQNSLVETPPDWSTFIYDYAKKTYELGHKVVMTDYSGPSDGYSHSGDFLDWITNLAKLATVSGDFYEELFWQYWAKLKHSLSAVERNDQLRFFTNVFVKIERLEAEDVVFELPAPSTLDMGDDASTFGHPLYEVRSKLVDRFAKTRFASAVFISEMYGVPEPIADLLVEVVPGFVPVIGDAFDLVDIGSMVATRQSSDGRKANALDWIMTGLFALTTSAGAFAALKKSLKASNQTTKYARFVDELEAIEQAEIDKLGTIAKRISDGGEMGADDLITLRRMLLKIDDAATKTGVTPPPIFDNLIGDNGFRHPYLERLFKLENAEDTIGLTDVARQRKAWLRNMSPDHDVRKLLTTAMGRKLSQIEFFNPPKLPTNYTDKVLAEFEDALIRYVEFFRPRLSLDDLAAGKKLSKASYGEILELQGPNGLGIDFDYERFPLEALNALAMRNSEGPLTWLNKGDVGSVLTDIPGKFQPGMPTNWPAWREIKVTGTGGGQRIIGLEVPGYRSNVSIQQTSKGYSRTIEETERAVWASNDFARWRLSGNAMYFEAIRRAADPKRKRMTRSMAGANIPVSKTIADADVKMGDLKKGGWYGKVNNHYDPLGEIPDELLEYQLRRHRLSPNVARPNNMPPLTQFDHAEMPQRVFYELCMRGLVRDETLVQITRRSIPADEFDDWLTKMSTNDEWKRATTIRNELNARLGQASGTRLQVAHQRIHAQQDAYAKFSGVKFLVTRLKDTTFMRDMANVPMDTIDFLIRHLDDTPMPPPGSMKTSTRPKIDGVLRWTLEQEIGSRNVLRGDVPNYEKLAAIPRDWKAGAHYLEALRENPDVVIRDVGRRLPTEEKALRLMRSETWSRNMIERI